MSFESIVLLIGVGLIIAIISAFTAIAVWDSKKGNNTYVITRESEEENFNDEGDVVSVRAEVVDMICGVSTIGYQAYKQPKAEKQFIIKFKSDGTDTFDVAVSEEMYEGFEVGLIGTLTLIDGQISSFELDNIN